MLLPGIYGRETRGEEKERTETILTEGTSKQNIYVQKLPCCPRFTNSCGGRFALLYIFHSTDILSLLKIVVVRLFDKLAR